MGVIRKTLSIGTLGAVSFRSKKERLRRAERAQRAAEAALDDEHAARVSAEDRAGTVEKHARRAETVERGRRARRRARKAARRAVGRAKGAAASARDVVEHAAQKHP